ncbi:MAG: hypothetical protein AB1348_03630 [Nitrospirota bacterium]
MRRYNASELKAKVERAGFVVVKLTSFVSLLLPLMAISRLRKKWGECDVMSELKLGGIINTILEKILNLEMNLIRLGVHLPFGGSLLLIAIKHLE